MDFLETYRRSLDDFAKRVGKVRPDQWAAPTPCSDWDVRTLVNHVVSEDMWSTRLLAGATIDQVGDAYEGDLLGDDPAGAARDAARQADRAAGEPAAQDGPVHLSIGDTPAQEYLHQLLVEHLVHGWDLSVAIGAPPGLDTAAVRTAAEWFAARTGLYRDGELTGPAVDVPAGAPAQDRLIAAFGRDPDWRPPR